MFKNLIPSTERIDDINNVRFDDNVTDAPASTQQPQAPKPPPLRFGALPIVLTPIQDRILIEETVREDGINDYRVYINGSIDSGNVYSAELVTLLSTLGSQSNVQIIITSGGGSLMGGARIAGAIRASDANITTVAVGLCGSAAALIWSYGKERIIAPGTVLLFHMSSHFDWGQSKDIAIYAENLVRYVKEIAIDPLVEMGVITEDEAETILDKRRDVFIDSYTITNRLAAAE